MKTISNLLLVLLFSVIFLVSCSDKDTSELPVKNKTSDKNTQPELKTSLPDKEPKELTEKQEIEEEIQRIRNLLRDKPTVKGWLIIGDANMHLKMYTEAASAYKEAYVLSEYSPETREKLKRAMYFVGLSNEENSE